MQFALGGLGPSGEQTSELIIIETVLICKLEETRHKFKLHKLVWTKIETNKNIKFLRKQVFAPNKQQQKR